MKITSVDINNEALALDLYFTSAPSLYKLLDRPAEEKQQQNHYSIINSVVGKSKLSGTKGADIFSFDSFDLYT